MLAVEGSEMFTVSLVFYHVLSSFLLWQIALAMVSQNQGTLDLFEHLQCVTGAWVSSTLDSVLL